MKYRIVIIVLLALLVLFASWFFFIRDSAPRGISNPPTAEDLRRIEAVEQSSSQIDPNAKTGVGVRPVGSIPPEPEPTQATSTTATSTGTTTDETE